MIALKFALAVKILRDVCTARRHNETMKHDQAPTIDDIAKAAGVSTATVSRVLNTPDVVRPKLRKRVEDHVRELGYVRHGAARALASARSHTVGVVIPTLDSAIFSSGVNAMESRLREKGYTLVLSVTNYDHAQEFIQVRRLIERGVDAMILVGRDHDDDTIRLLTQRKCPFVTTWAFADHSEMPCVGFDNHDAARQATQHLIDLGHIKIAAIAGRMSGNDRARDRIAGVKSALAAGGMELAVDDLIESAYEVASGREAMRRLMGRPESKRPTAVFCGNDVLAIGAVIEAQALGLNVPADVSVVGFDNLPLAEHLSPALTTIHVPSRRMGQAAADFVLSAVSGQQDQKSIPLPTTLMIRETTAAPRKNSF